MMTTDLTFKLFRKAVIEFGGQPVQKIVNKLCAASEVEKLDRL